MHATRMRASTNCSPATLLSSERGRWRRIDNASTPWVYSLKNKVGDGLRRHEQGRRTDPSLPALPEYLTWRWHPTPGCRLREATQESLCRALAALSVKEFW